MKTITHNGHTIAVKLFGTEKVYYDGNLMSSGFSVFGSTYTFQAEEEAETVTYEVEMLMGFFVPWMKIRRNGVLIYTDK